MDRITDAICSDHEHLQSYYDRIVHAESSDEQIRYQNMFTWELARHVVGEELVLYPALEKHLHEDAAEDRRQHQLIKEQLATFQNLPASNPEFLPTITTLMDGLQSHVHHEETEDLTQLENTISREESTKLAASFERTKRFVPTRAHPSAPTQYPYQTAVGLITAPLDYLQDIFRRWPDDGKMELMPSD